MSSNNGQPPPTCPSSTGGAAEDTAEAEKEEEITLFAPFGAQKPSKSVFQHSSEYEGEFSDGRSDSREIEFQSSETPSVGNAPKVLFRKLKAAVSGSSLSSLSMSTSVQEPSSVTLKPPVNKPPGSSNRAGPNSSKAPSADTRAYRSRNSPTPSLGSSVAISVEQGGISGDPHMRTVEQALSEEPKISLTSYSDAHGHVLRKTGHPSAGGGGGVVRQQSQAVNKSEMLKRFGTIADNKGVQNTSADFKKYWMPDKACKECSECNIKFGVFVRRHHCRICGRIFCHSCCNTTIPGALLRPDLQGNLRVCKECCEIFTEFRMAKLKGPDKASQPSDSAMSDHSPSVSHPPSLQVGVEANQQLQGSGNFGRPLTGSRPVGMSILSPHKSWDEASSGRSQEVLDMSPSASRSNMEFDTPSRRNKAGRKPSSFDTITERQQRQRSLILDEDEVGLIASAIWPKFLDPDFGCTRMTHRRYRLRNFPDSYTGSGIVDWLKNNGHVSSRSAGMQIGQALVDTKRLKIVSSINSVFKDETNQFLELGEAAMLPVVEDGNSPVVRDAPKWFQHLPQESDSEYEVARGGAKESSPSPQTQLSPYKPPYEHSVTLSSFSKLTSSRESLKDPQKPSDDDLYLVVDEELMSKSDTERDSSMPSSPPSSPSPMLTIVTPKRRAASARGQLYGSSPSVKVQYSTKSPSVSFDDNCQEVLETLPVSETVASDTPRSYAEAEVMFRRNYNKHFNSLMTQLLKANGLCLSWLEIIRPLIMRATQTVRTDVFSEDIMDINEYVRVKKLLCGAKSDSSLTHGVVCTKNVTHKKMCTTILNPTILLLKCAFDFQRRENQLSSFDTLYLQENKYLQNLVDKVKAFKPKIILVQKSVSRLALEDLYDLGIVVVVNVKPSVMERVARCTQGEILTSLDQLFFDVRLGTCGKFYLRNFTLESGIKKTLMYFDKCDPKLGCVITLQGGASRELKKVKKVTQFGLHMAYNSLLESSFLLDEYAWPCSEEDEAPYAFAPSEPYSPTSSTPEYPLYPSLPHPLDSLPPAELVKRLEALGVEAEEAEEAEEAVGGDETEGEKVLKEPDSESLDMKSVPSQAEVAGSEGGKAVDIPDTQQQPNSNSVNSHSDSSQTASNTEPSTQDQENSNSIPHGPDSIPPDSNSVLPESNSQTTSSQQLLQIVVSKAELTPEDRLKLFHKDVLVDLGEKEFLAALGSQILSISPSVRFTVPYLQTPRGREADIRQYLPNTIFWSYQFRPTLPVKPRPLGVVKEGQGSGDVEKSSLEMGITKELVETVQPVSRDHSRSCDSTHSRSRSQISYHQPSYKSVSEHPLTYSFLLLKANTNEMRAALADFRSRAGLSMEDNQFFFKSAKVAADYRLHLQNVFNKYKQFGGEFESDEEEEKEEKGVEEQKEEVEERKEEMDDRKEDGKKEVDDKEDGKKKEEGAGGWKVDGGRWWKRKRDHRSQTPTITLQVTSDPGKVGVAPETPTPQKTPTAKQEANSKQEVTPQRQRNVSTSSSKRAHSSSPRETSPAQEALHVSPIQMHITGGGGGGGAGHDTGWREMSGNIMSSRGLGDMDRGRRAVSEDLSGSQVELSYEEVWLNSEQQVDCLDPIKHQGISVLFSNTCHDRQKHQQRPCLPPCVIPMFYYGHNDISIGDFLQRYCFREYYRCQTCGVDMARHIRHIIHGPNALHISIQTADNNLPGKEEHIYTWLACVHCQNSTPYTMMSPNSLLFSFAKFLELKFYCDSYRARSDVSVAEEGVADSIGATHCPHCLHKDYIHCFIFGSKLATFKPSTVDILEVLLPPRAIQITTPTSKYHHDYAADIKHVGRLVEGVFCRIRQKLEKYRLDPVASSINDHISNSKVERSALRTKVKALKDLVVSSGFMAFKTPPQPGSILKTGSKVTSADIPSSLQEESISSVQDGLADLKRAITEVVECWNILFEELDVKVRDYRRRMREMGDVVMAEGLASNSPRDSPVSASQAITDSTVTVTAREEPAADTPPVITPISQSPELGTSVMSHDIITSKLQEAVDGLANSSPQQHEPRPPPEEGPRPSVQGARKVSHERHQSDVVSVSSEVRQVAGEHRRNLSDSQALGKEAALELASLHGAEGVSSGSTPSSASVDVPVPSGLAVSSAHKGSVSEDPPPTIAVEGGTEKEGEGRLQYQSIKRMPGQSSSERSGGQVDEEPTSHTDGQGGFQILAKFRDMHIGGEKDARDDPTKFYLLDPYVNTAGAPSKQPSVAGTSPSSSGSLEGGGKGVAKRHIGNIRRAVSSTSVMSADSHSHTESRADKRYLRDKDRSGVLSRPFQKLPPPFEFHQHHTMHAHTTLPIAIYEREPTSIIAYALSSRDYQAKLQVLIEKGSTRHVSSSATLGAGVAEGKGVQNNASPKLKRLPAEPDRPLPSNTSKRFFSELKKKGSNISIFGGLSGPAPTGDPQDPFEYSIEVSPRKLESTTSSSGQSMRSGDGGGADAPPPSSGGVGAQDDVDQGKVYRGHVSLEFSNPERTANFFCKVYFAEEFRQLRKRIFPSGEEKFIRSLTRCVKYEAKGGKSRSAFCKVADDRFILKQIKSIEISAFEDFAPRYLDYINKALEEKRPLALAKILGVYSIGFKNTKTGSSKRMDVVVMENILYGRTFSRVFDLKGSMRSRYIDPSKDSSGDVLLDENYLNSICHDPVYIHPHSKHVLMQAILADSEFLAKNSVMDYSLLTCIDDTTGFLVVGIIDYVRTFTFDKRLEMYLKKTSGRELPTVVYPELYRKRFYEAMDRYFTMVPDKWSGLVQGVDFQ